MNKLCLWANLAASMAAKVVTIDVEMGSKLYGLGILPGEHRKVGADLELDVAADFQQIIGNMTEFGQNANRTDLTLIDVVKNLTDYRDVQIYTKAYVGSSNQEFDMIFDTGSNWLWVDSRLCSNCPIKGGFDERLSKSFKTDPWREQIELNYGSGSVVGFNTFDSICLNPS